MLNIILNYLNIYDHNFILEAREERSHPFRPRLATNPAATESYRRLAHLY